MEVFVSKVFVCVMVYIQLSSFAISMVHVTTSYCMHPCLKLQELHVPAASGFEDDPPLSSPSSIGSCGSNAPLLQGIVTPCECVLCTCNKLCA